MKKILLVVLLFISIKGSNGQTAWLWAKSAGSNIEDYATAVATDASGNVIVAGAFKGATMIFGSDTLHNYSGNYNYNVFFVKYTSAGSVAWARQIGGSNGDIFITGTATDASGNIYIAGGRNGLPISFDTVYSPPGNIFLAKYNSSGHALWVRGAGGGTDQATAVTTDAFGNVMITGVFTETAITFGSKTITNAGINEFTVKYDGNGNVKWASGGFAPCSVNNPHTITTDASGNVFIAGSFTKNSAPNAYYEKFDSTGAPGWSWANWNGMPCSITGFVTDKMNNVYVGGYFSNQLELNNGITLYDATFTGTNFFLVKINPNGTLIWAKYNRDIIVNAMCMDDFDEIYITGYFNVGVTFKFGPSTVVNNNGADIFVGKLDTAGTPLWAIGAGGKANDYAYSVAADGFGNAYTVGKFASDTMPFGSIKLPNVAYLSKSDMFIAKLSFTTGMQEPNNNNDLFIYPNPTTDNFIVSFTKPMSNASLKIFNMMGEKVYEVSIGGSSKQEIKTGNLARGIYFVRVSDDERQWVEKIVVE